MAKKNPTRSGETGLDPSNRIVWDTSYVPSADRFSFFREGICQSFLALTPTRPEGIFTARVEKMILSAGWIGRNDVTPHNVRRTASDRSSLGGQHLHLCMRLKGSSEVEVGGRSFPQHPGDAVLMETAMIEGFSLKSRKQSRSINVILDRCAAGIDRHLKEKHHVLFAERTLHDPLKACLHLIEERFDAASTQEMSCLFDASVSILAARLCRDRDFLEDKCNSMTSARAGILGVVKQSIRSQIADPALNVERVAAQFGISARYLQILFQGEGTTFKRFLTGLRLDRVQLDLSDPAKGHIAAIDIAFRWGFRDKTTFHRNYKERFGDTPMSARLPTIIS